MQLQGKERYEASAGQLGVWYVVSLVVAVAMGSAAVAFQAGRRVGQSESAPGSYVLCA